MENASKALIIAGAVLIAILLIAFGMIMINAAQTPIDEATSGIGGQGVQAFNRQFDIYAGQRVSGSNVKSLLSAINSNNVASSHIIAVTFTPKTGTGISGATTGVAGQIANVINTKSYSVVFAYSTEGYIDTCTIAEL